MTLEPMVWVWVQVTPYLVENADGRRHRVVREGHRKDGTAKVLLTDKRLGLDAADWKRVEEVGA